ncbi:mechanosensitive ion channel family protein [Rufibacter tibetensis]|uniref:mechanosensitive ion channel family protein n=1 Tax=Rufibacter tibetensis TaxID=512763 RepID=UPI0007811760|nr:mechanosensitive ion channel domain-containing protein [Rufibacter tibetensis]
MKGAENRLKNFRQASMLAVAITGFIMLLVTPGEAGLARQDPLVEDSAASAEDLGAGTPEDTAFADSVQALSGKEATDEALGAIQTLWDSFHYNLPKFLIALGTLLLAWAVTWLLRKALQRLIGNYHTSGAVISLASISVWLLGIGIAFSVVAGDIRALVGSLGLIGLALSWSLQTPIESFTGWLLNSFKGYYRVGDRIRVGEVFGDVYRIDFLATTVWEIGSPFQAGFVHAEQPTGRMVTFPNNEILTGTVTNLTGDFPFLWDELSIAVANESDIPLSVKVLGDVASKLLGGYMEEPARQYAQILGRARLQSDVPGKPQVYISLEDSWTSLTIRYLVGARERRKWKSELTLRVIQESARPEYAGRIIPVYPRQQVQVIGPSGLPMDAGPFGGSPGEDREGV